MDIYEITSFLVYPGKNLKQLPEIKGTKLPLKGSLYTMLEEIYKKSDKECNIPIRFLMADEGSQNNLSRDLLVAYIESPGLEKGKEIANRLCSFTTNNPGLGLLFLILGGAGKKKKLVISRFPAKKGVLAETQGQGLQIEFIERIFMKSATSYKAAVYNDSSLKAGFWDGFAIDKQLNTSFKEIADYWIHDFLLSDFKTTSAAGTKRFAVAIKEASKKAQNGSVKHEIVSLGILACGQAGKVMSIQRIMDNFGLSTEAKEVIASQLENKRSLEDEFVLDKEEFKRHASFASVELSNEGILIAPAERFNECFPREEIDQKDHIYRFSTEGRIVDERVRGRK
jgi:hypothetical protein